MNGQDHIPLSQLEPLLQRAELLLEKAMEQRRQDHDDRRRAMLWLELELNRCALPLQQLGEDLAKLMERMALQRQDSIVQQWQADLQQGLRQLEAVCLQLDELQASAANNALPTLEVPLIERPDRQLQDLLSRRQKQLAVVMAELNELRNRTNNGFDTQATQQIAEAAEIPSLFDDQN